MTILVMTGVTALTRATAWQMERNGVEFPAEKIGDWLRQADLTHISHEVAFDEDCPPPDPSQAGLRFCSDPNNIALLEIVGTDLVELTGNHVQDAGSEALSATIAAYRSRDWGVYGGGETLREAYEPFLVEHNGNQFAFIGCNQPGPKYAWATEENPGATPCDFGILLPTVEALSTQGYLVIFSFQWGEGSVVIPSQREGFRSAVDAGAVVVSGSQAHQALGMEFYNDGFIHYGLGNLFFDQMQSPQLRSELIDRHIFYEGRHIIIELLTAYLESYAQPRPMTEEERSSFLAKIFEDSGW
jgi:poly-gamma-glutamate synthesis protein (capsule biosynthesis protein)